MEVSEAEIKEMVDFMNADPRSFLELVCSRKKAEISVGGAKYKVAKDNIKGGAVVFFPSRVVHFHWDKNDEKWFLSSF